MMTLEKTSLDEELEKLDHGQLLELTQSSLRRLLASDPLLNDLPSDVTTEEVLAQVAVVQGQSITINVLRNSESPLSVVIPQQGTTVRDLKKTIQRAFGLKQQRQRSKTKISWRYIWRTYNLQHGSEVLRNDNELVYEERTGYCCGYCRDDFRKTSECAFGDEMRFWKALLGLIVAVSEIEVIRCSDYPWLDQITRQDVLSAGCNSYVMDHKLQLNVSQLDHILVDHNHKFLYCYVPKVACTNWKRVLMVLTDFSNTTDLVSIPASLAHEDGVITKLSQLPPEKALKILKTYTAFVMVRHPFERLLSAYRNKFVGDKPSAKYFQTRIGRYIIRKYRKNPSERDLENGDNVSFREFVNYLIEEGVNDESANEHWRPISQLCQPCLLNYTFIGKYEKFDDDAKLILKMIDAPFIQFPQTKSGRTADHLRMYFGKLSLDKIKQLYEMYELDFKLFGYDLENVIGYDIG
ncbi:hypothetical protein Trydic_g20551 [Trypoxylus dichotomus]